jgi:hypothetical protein
VVRVPDYRSRDPVPVPGGNKYSNPALQVGRVSQTETIKYAHGSLGTQTRENLHFRCLVTTENYRSDFSSERPLHINKSASLKIIKDIRR